MRDVLVLNRSYMPVAVVNWKEAIVLWYKEKVEVLSSYEDIPIRSVNLKMKAPSVIRLLYYVRPKRNITIYRPFTRKNIWARDEGVCQYCGKEVSYNKYTVDHVTPKSQGGLSTWTNVVCSCHECNNRKADKSVAQAGLKLLNKPFAPKIANSIEEYNIERLKEIKNVDENWKDFFYWQKR